MHLRTMLSLFLLATTAAAAAAETTLLHVATNGNDSWSGRLAEPKPDHSDGPVATLERVRDLARTAKSAGPVTVRIRGGTHRRISAFVLRPEDSGTATAPVAYEAFPGERPVLSGGRIVTGFRQHGLLWEAEIPDVKSGHTYFRQLFVNGQRRTRARSPNQDYFRAEGFFPGASNAQQGTPYARDRFVFAAGDLAPWPQLADVNLVMLHSWETSIHPVQSIDPATRVVTLSAPMKEWWGLAYWEKHPRYYVENAREFLDQPGEWYLDRGTGVLSYWPLPGETIDTADVVAPRLTELLRLEGDADHGRFVEYVAFRGIAFHHADWVLDPKGNSSTQAAVEVPAPVVADGARHCTLERCEIAHVGTYGIWFRRGCKDDRLVQNRIFDLGAGGIRVGEDHMAATDVAETSGTLVDNNHIFDGGHVYPAGVGIWVAQSSSNTISHNDIHDLRYSGISIGWNWGLDPNRTHHNIVAWNHVHDLVHGMLSDAGLIYCLGVSPGSVIRNNVFHDIWPYHAPELAWGIYLDAQCGGYLVESNLVYNTRNGGLMFNNGGHEHSIRNNIFALSASEALWPYSEKRPSSFRQNIVYLTQGRLLVSHGEASLKERLAKGESPGDWDRNVYWHADGPDAVRFYQRTLAEWQSLGLDVHSVIADPLFTDVARGDFRFGPTSPAAMLGIQPLDLRGVGLYGDPSWMAEVRHEGCTMKPLPPPPPPPVAVEIDDTFESTEPGGAPAQAMVSGEEFGARIRISEERAAGGRRSLKIADTKSTTPAWQPHFYYRPHLTNGIVRQEFDLWLARDAALATEWRDQVDDYPRCNGPSVRMDGQGRVTVGGKVLATVPLESWYHVAIEAGVGSSADRTFSLSLTATGASPLSFTNLPIDGTAFRAVHWLGFSSLPATDTSAFIDNLRIRCLP